MGSKLRLFILCANFKKIVCPLRFTKRLMLASSPKGVLCFLTASAPLWSIDKISRNESIKQACINHVNSTSTLLTTVVSTIIDTSDNYQKAIKDVTSMMEEFLTVGGYDAELWDRIVARRSELSDIRADFRNIILVFESIDMVVTASVQVTFNTGDEYLSGVLTERLAAAEIEVKKIKADIADLEEKYLLMQAVEAKSKISN